MKSDVNAIVYGPIEDQCLYRLDGKYYMKRQIHKYKRTPEWTGSAFMGISNPTIYRRAAEQGTLQYVYMECALEESDYYLKRDRDGSYAGSWKSYDGSWYADDLGQTLEPSLPVPETQFNRQAAKKLPIKRYRPENNRMVDNRTFFRHLDELRTLRTSVQMPESFRSNENDIMACHHYKRNRQTVVSQPDRAPWLQRGIAFMDKIAVDYPATVVLTLVQYRLWAD